MAITRAWDETNISNATIANQIDDRVNEKLGDLRERLSTVNGGGHLDFTTFPNSGAKHALDASGAWEIRTAADTGTAYKVENLAGAGNIDIRETWGSGTAANNTIRLKSVQRVVLAGTGPNVFTVALEDNSIYNFRITVTAQEDAGTRTGDAALDYRYHEIISTFFRNGGGNSTIVGSATTVRAVGNAQITAFTSSGGSANVSFGINNASAVTFNGIITIEYFRAVGSVELAISVMKSAENSLDQVF